MCLLANSAGGQLTDRGERDSELGIFKDERDACKSLRLRKYQKTFIAATSTYLLPFQFELGIWGIFMDALDQIIPCDEPLSFAEEVSWTLTIEGSEGHPYVPKDEGLLYGFLRVRN